MLTTGYLKIRKDYKFLSFPWQRIRNIVIKWRRIQKKHESKLHKANYIRENPVVTPTSFPEGNTILFMQLLRKFVFFLFTVKIEVLECGQSELTLELTMWPPYYMTQTLKIEQNRIDRYVCEYICWSWYEPNNWFLIQMFFIWF